MAVNFLSVSDCKYNLMYQFTFDISAIADREHVLKSALRVYFENNQSSDVQSNDRILATLGDMNGTTITNKILDGLSSQWMEFDVGSIVDSWKASGIFNIAPQGFTIQLDYLHDNGPHTNIKCSDSTYRLVIDSLSDINKHPLLIIYTHDSDQTKTDIFKGLEKIIMKTEGLEIMEKDTVTKRASATESTPISCGQLTQVIVTKAWLNTIFHPYGFMIIGPNKMELNLCGGSCDNVLSSTPHHAALLATYATRNDTNFEGSQFRKCCVPIGYNAMTIITRSTNTSQARELKIERLEDATARRCGCIFTYDF